MKICTWRAMSMVALTAQLMLNQANADPTADILVSGSSLIISGSVFADGEGFPATTPNSGALHRNAIIVENSGTLTLANGATVQVANNNGDTAFLRVGYNDSPGGNGTLIINPGAVLQIGQSSRYANFHIGEGVGVTGVVNQSGGSVTTLGSLNIGVDGGTGTYTISGGSLTIDNADDAGHTSLATIGLNLNAAGGGTSNGLLVINGGTVSVLAHELGVSGTFGSTALILGNRDRGVGSYGDGNGAITQNGGVLYVNNNAGLYLSSVGSGTYNLNGGQLQIGGNSFQSKYGSGPGTYAFNLGSGTISVTGSDLNSSVNVQLVSNAASVINTNGLNANWTGNFTGSGSHQVGVGGNGLYKIGSGTLTISGSNNVFDTFATLQGSTRLSAGQSSAVEFMVGSGSGSVAQFLLSGGTLTINPSLSGTNVVAGSFRVGDFSGNGTFNQTGGALVISNNSGFNIGNQGGSGVYNLSGGRIDLNNSLNILGRSDGSHGPSNGLLAISGGTLNIRNGGSLILGNNLQSDSSTGVLNQGGGTVYVDGSSSLWLSGLNASSGTYNLSGGVLQIGGNSLKAKYSSGNAINNFNFGNGSIQVTGTDLTSNVAPTLMASSTAIINTNGFNAIFSGTFNGNGGSLRKLGVGQLTVSAINSTNGTLSVENGGLAVKNGGTVALTTTIGAAGTLAISNNPNSTGSITFSAGLNTETGSVIKFTLGPSSNDVINVSGGINIGDGTIFQLTGLAGLDLNVNHTWNLIVDQSAIPNINLDNVSLQLSGVLGAVQMPQVNVFELGNSVQLVYEAIPEPQTWCLIGVGIGLLALTIKYKESSRKKRLHKKTNTVR